MEHIVQFAINIDDDRIRKIIEETAEKQIIEEIKKEVERSIFQSYYSGGINKGHLQMWATDKLINSIIEENKEQIIEQAVKSLADKLGRTKMAKEKLADVLDGLEI